MKLTGDWLEAAGTQQVLGLLNAAGHEAYAVGGAVRNAILGQPVADVDLCSDALPQEVIALAKAAGLKALPTGIDHGTVTILSHGQPYEVTTFRHDVKTNGRHAEVSFSKDIQEDALRRDFTMNALYAKADGSLVDPLGGLPDALAGRLRFVGDARTRIREDYLRILRFFRFLAYYGDPQEGPDAEGLAACAELAEGVQQLSKERIGSEMKKLLCAANPAPAVASMAAAGVLQQILPGSDAKALPILIHLEEDCVAPSWQRRLAVLGGEDPAPLLRLSNAEAKALAAIRKAAIEGGRPAILGHDLGAQGAEDAILARAALLEMPPPLGWQEEVARGVEARFPVTAADLMPQFTGPALGAKLKELQNHWREGDLYPSKKELLAL